jgi:hypothetical protein
VTGGSISGVVGRIEWAYHVAAELQGYVVTRSPENRWSLVATPTRADPFQLRQRPLVFVGPTAHGDLCFPIESIDVGPTYIKATLGAPW